ncbi:MAG TPA: RiPP maturation radical SAM C-methyltransferase [Rhizomicrobium sp.]
MPFYSALRPSLQICGLAALARARGFAVDTLHLSLDLAARIGTELHEELGTFGGYELGNWLFAPAAFPDSVPDPDFRLPCDCPGALLHLEPHGIGAARLAEMRREDDPAILESAFAAADWTHYDVVGFSSTFQQNNASFALARRLKQAFPRLIVLFGGANFESVMGAELVRANAFIDFAVDGEGDVAFVEILDAVAQGRDPGAVAGVISRRGRGGGEPRAPADLGATLAPDYDEYFVRAEALGVVPPAGRAAVRVPFEGSRGCWWGEKHHCTFCGLNGQTMKFRQKSSAQVLDELAEISRKWGVFNFAAVDNIMAPDFWRDFVPRLTEDGPTYRLFFEVKSNLTRVQVKALADAGIVEIQPGIESLSSRVLKLMDKGVKGIQNVNLLRWARYYGIKLDWNLLYGFPGETEADYQAQTRLLPHLRHLDPPATAGRIWMERFSPIFDDRARFPARYVRPLGHLSYVYPPDIDLSRIGYFFEYEFEDSLPDAVYAPYVEAAHAWRDDRPAGFWPHLSYLWSPGILQIFDGRRPGGVKRYDFPSPLAEIYRAISDRPLTAAMAAAKVGLPGDAAEVGEALDVLEEKGFVMRDGDLFLALGLPARP